MIKSSRFTRGAGGRVTLEGLVPWAAALGWGSASSAPSLGRSPTAQSAWVGAHIKLRVWHLDVGLSFQKYVLSLLVGVLIP